MSEQEDQHSHGGHESVEEAVFKYVGVGLNKQVQEDEHVHSQHSHTNSPSTPTHNHDHQSNKDSEKISWYLRQELETPNLSEETSNNVAAAAVAAAFAVEDDGKKRILTSDLRNNSKKLKTKQNKLQLAVDPELTSLDHNEHDHLVRKAIMDVDNISQHPDFRQYLNTEEDSEDRVKKYSGSKLEDSLSMNDEARVVLKKTEVLPKVLAPGISSDQNISHLIQQAASKASNIINPQSQVNGKAFDSAEEEALEHFIRDYQQIRNLSRHEICARIWSNERRKDDFWTNICKVLPYRTRSSIYKHVRRKYHIFEQRGKWTPEEDAELARWCAEKEGQWSNIGKVLGRMPEDCRDRWRNYVKCGANRASNKWSVEEEERLKMVINEILENSPDEIQLEKDGTDYDQDDPDDHKKKEKEIKKRKKSVVKDVINWTVVSERMGGTRSRIQCRYKWNKLLKKEAMNKIKTIRTDDKAWLLKKLRDMGFTEDSQVDWEELSTLMPGNRWTGTELKFCYEKWRSSIRNYRKKSIHEICKELIANHVDSIPLDTEIKDNDM